MTQVTHYLTPVKIKKKRYPLLSFRPNVLKYSNDQRELTRRFSPKLRKPQLQAITSFIPKVRIIQPLPPAHFEREAGKVSGRGKGLK